MKVTHYSLSLDESLLFVDLTVGHVSYKTTSLLRFIYQKLDLKKSSIVSDSLKKDLSSAEIVLRLLVLLLFVV